MNRSTRAGLCWAITYTLRAEINRDGRIRDVKKNVEVQAGRTSNVTLDFGAANRERE